jgi:hypothetical protein
MPGLQDSRWAFRSYRYGAPLTSELTIAPPNTLNIHANANPAIASQPLGQTASPAEELSRYTKLVRRLKWKLPYLAEGYRLATLPAPPASELFAEGARKAKVEAELMFKLDFFEYYMLLERALVHLLGVFGVVVSREFGAAQLERDRIALAPNGKTNGWPSRSRDPSPNFSHRYHANVLDALDNASNPLYAVLGAGAQSDVRRQLGRAKDLRNRWKNADDAASAGQGQARGQQPPMALESYDLEHILAAIFAGFDEAFVVAEAWVAEIGAREPSEAAEGGQTAEMPGSNVATEEEQWEFMVDAMDWEAV